jgi:uncharacterized membrane protein
MTGEIIDINPSPNPWPNPSPTLLRVAHIVYALHALGLVIGAFGAATVIGMFLFGWPSIIAVIVNYIYRGDARGTWLESHFRWQIRTFWFALIWALLVGGVSLVLMLVLIGLITWPLGLGVLGLWAIYRVARGWLRLNDRRPMSATNQSQ